MVSPIAQPPNTHPDDSLLAKHRLPFWCLGLILTYGATLLLANLGSTRVLTYHEALYAQSAREMLADGHWIVPTFAGVPNTHKPPGNHAAIAIAMAVTGSQNEAVVRLPSVLSALATAVLIGMLGARWFGHRVGLIAGLMHVTMYYVLQLARLSESDMPLSLSVCGAMTCFALAHVDSPLGKVQRPWLPALFYLCVGLSFLFKGLIGPAFALSGCVAYTLWQRDMQALRFLLNPLGLVIFTSCTAGWYIAAYWQHPQIFDAFVHNHVSRFQGELGGEKPLFFYGYVLLLITLPWSPWLLVAVYLHGRRLFTEDWGRFALSWIGPGMLLLSLSEFKSQHYPAPLIPPLTILAGMGLLDWIRMRQKISGRWHLLAGSLSTLGCLAAAVIVYQTQPRAAEIIIGLILLLGIALAFLCYCEYRKHTSWELGTLFGTAWICAAIVLSVVMPRYDSYRDQAEMADRINARIPDGEPIYLVKLPRNQITFYLEQPVVRIDDPARFSVAWKPEHRPAYVLAPQFVADAMAKIGNIEVLDQCVSINRYLTERDRLTLIQLNPANPTSIPSPPIRTATLPERESSIR